MKKNKKNKKKARKIIKKRQLIKQCDRLFSLIVRQKMKECFICGSINYLTCGHIITRSVYAVRWSFNNAVTQCKNCNYLHEYRPEILIKKYIDVFGIEKFNNLYKESKEVKKINIPYLELLKKELNNIYKEFNSGV